MLMRPCAVVGVGTWVPLVNQVPNGASIFGLLLLSDGTVMCADNGTRTNWYRLAPDQHGSYVNGNWSEFAAMHYPRSGFASDVVPDGRVFVAGGEYAGGGSPDPGLTTNAEIFDPVANSWTMIGPPISLFNPNTNSDCHCFQSYPQVFSDMISVAIPNGSVLMAPVNPRNYGGTLIYNPKANAWSDGPVLTNNAYDQAECSWAKLADGSILTIDTGSTNSERYIPSLNRWVPDGLVAAYVWNNVSNGDEIGPAVTLSNGKAFFMGGNGTNVLYTPSGNTSPGVWTLATVSPTDANSNQLEIADAPGAMMVNGKFLCVLATNCINGGCFQAPYYLYEYDYSVGPGGSFTVVLTNYSGAIAMLDLPDGTVLLSDFTSQLYVYQPDGSPLPSGKPTITSITANADGSFHVTGTGLNGISEGGTFGDELQNNENYPLVRMTNNSSGLVYYARTYNWSSTGIQTGSTPVTTEFTLPAGVFAGGGTNYSLVVVANGIASDPVPFAGPVWVDFNYHGTPQIGTLTFPYSTLAQGVTAVAASGTIFIKPGTSAETPTITKPMTILAIGGAATVGQ